MKLIHLITLTDFFLMCPKGILVNSNKKLCDGPQCGYNCSKDCPELLPEWITNRYEIGRKVLFKAKKVISPSIFLAKKFTDEYPQLKVQVINHGIKSNALKKNDRFYRVGDPLVFCYAGGLKKHKGIHLLINAFLKLQSTNVELKIFGSGSDRYLKKLKNMAGDDRRIEFCGVYLDEQISEVLSGVDMVILPSLWHENYPLILHEALASDVPVICSNTGGMEEKIKDGWNGFTFQLGDSHQLRKVLERVSDNPAVLNDIKKNLHLSSIPTIEEEANTYEKEYQQILKEKHKKGKER